MYICEEPHCEKISKSRDEIRKHCNREHDWKSTTEEREHWHQVWAQTFFNSAGLQRYFTVVDTACWIIVLSVGAGHNLPSLIHAYMQNDKFSLRQT